MKCLLLIVPILIFSLFACNESSTEPDTSVPLPIQFTLDSLPKGLNPDSLNVKMMVGDSLNTLVYDWLSGGSRGSLRAKEGDSFTVRFELYACNFRIGQGESSGVFKKNQTLVLRADWDTGAIAKARLCRMGTCIPADPSAGFNLALAGKRFEFPASCDSGATYRWFVRIGDRTVLAGEETANAFVIPDSLLGAELSVRIQVVVNGKVIEERKWTVKVISGISRDKMVRILFRNHPEATDGTSQGFFYDEKGQVVAISTYDDLHASAVSKPIAVESLFYDTDGRVIRASVVLPDGESLDSLFRYDASGLLLSIRISTGNSELLDSLRYAGGRPVLSLRFVNGALRDSVVFRNGRDFREDSVFSIADSVRSFTRLIQNYYRTDSLVERRVWINSGLLSPYKREVIVYNGIGKRGYRQVFSVGQTLILEGTEQYAYDDQGRLKTFLSRDEVRGENVLAMEYVYTPIQAAAKRAATPVARPNGHEVVSDLRFAYEDWKLTRPIMPRR
jgi:hypothetical protein